MNNIGKLLPLGTGRDSVIDVDEEEEPKSVTFHKRKRNSSGSLTNSEPDWNNIASPFVKIEADKLELDKKVYDMQLTQSSASVEEEKKRTQIEALKVVVSLRGLDDPFSKKAMDKLYTLAGIDEESEI